MTRGPARSSFAIITPRLLLPVVLTLAPLAFGVEGEVFVTSNAGNVIALPSVTVRAYRASDYLAYIAHSGAAKKRYEKIGRRLAGLLDDYADATRANIPEEDRTRLEEQSSAESRKLMEELADFAPSFLSSLPLNPLAQAVTAADGHYVLPLKNPAAAVIIAVASRPGARANEHYYWVIFHPPDQLNLSPQARTKEMPWDPGLLATAK